MSVTLASSMMKSTTLSSKDRSAELASAGAVVAIEIVDLPLAARHCRVRSITARFTSSSVTAILFFSPISDSTRPSRTRRAAIFRYSSYEVLFGGVLVGEGPPRLLHRG